MSEDSAPVAIVPGTLAPQPAPALTLPLLSRRRERGLLIQKLQHALPAVVLLLAGFRHLVGGDRGWALVLAIAEIASSALLLRAVGKELRAVARGERPHAHGVDWAHLLTGGVLLVEAFEHWHTHHHVPRPTVLLAFLMIALGLLHDRFSAFAQRRRALRLDRHGVRIGRRLLFLPSFSAGWNEIAEISLTEREARIRTRRAGEYRIDLSDLRNSEEVGLALGRAREFLSR